MDLNIKQILSEHDIHFVTSGKNVAKNHINIKCPYCGSRDPSQHLGIDLSTLYWACWRNKLHCGKNIYRLLYKLEIRIERTGFIPETFDALLAGDYFKKEEKSKPVEPVFRGLPKSFIPITHKSAIDNYYLNYLKLRGFDEPEFVVEQYNLMRCNDLSSKWNNRLIIPIPVNDQLCWTARTISSYDEPKYLSPNLKEAINIKHCLFNYNDLKVSKAKAIVLTEGVFDCLKGEYYAAPDYRFTCLFGVTLTQEQIELIRAIYTNFDRVYIALDREATLESIEISNKLRFANCQIAEVISNKDPGSMNESEVENFVSIL